MDFQLDTEQQMLAASLRRYLDDHYTFEHRRRLLAEANGSSPTTWAALAELGLFGLALDPAHDGYSGRVTDLMPSFELFGASLMLEPVLPHVLGLRLLAHSEHTEHLALRAGALAGHQRLAFAHTEPDAGYQRHHVATTAQRTANGWQLDGAKLAVHGAPLAHYLVLSATVQNEDAAAAATPRIALFLVPADSPGLVRTDYLTFDNLAASDLTLARVTLPAHACLIGPEAGSAALDDTLDVAAALQCAETLGAVTAANQDTLEYLKTRRQFGMPLGSFQALQHRAVECYIQQVQLQSITLLACARLDSDLPREQRARAVAAAGLKATATARHVAQESVQMHGGMGLTEELRISHLFRRLTLIGREFADVHTHRRHFLATEPPAAA